MDITALLQLGAWIAGAASCYIVLAIFGAARTGHALIHLRSPRKVLAAAFLGKDPSAREDMRKHLVIR